MLTLRAEQRDKKGKQTRSLRKKGILPVVIYGSDLKPISAQISLKDFEKAYLEVGENALLHIALGGKRDAMTVIVKDVERDPLSGAFLHADFLQPRLTEKMEANIPVDLEGEAPAVKELGGTLIRNIHELRVRALPQDLPREIIVSTETLATFDDAIHIRDLRIPGNVEILHEPDELVCKVVEPSKVEEELAKPIEEKVEEVERAEEKKKEGEETETVQAPQ